MSSNCHFEGLIFSDTLTEKGQVQQVMIKLGTQVLEEKDFLFRTSPNFVLATCLMQEMQDEYYA